MKTSWAIDKDMALWFNSMAKSPKAGIRCQDDTPEIVHLGRGSNQEQLKKLAGDNGGQVCYIWYKIGLNRDCSFFLA